MSIRRTVLTVLVVVVVGGFAICCTGPVIITEIGDYRTGQENKVSKFCLEKWVEFYKDSKFKEKMPESNPWVKIIREKTDKYIKRVRNGFSEALKKKKLELIPEHKKGEGALHLKLSVYATQIPPYIKIKISVYDDDDVLVFDFYAERTIGISVLQGTKKERKAKRRKLLMELGEEVAEKLDAKVNNREYKPKEKREEKKDDKDSDDKKQKK